MPGRICPSSDRLDSEHEFLQWARKRQSPENPLRSREDASQRQMSKEEI